MAELPILIRVINVLLDVDNLLVHLPDIVDPPQFDDLIDEGINEELLGTVQLETLAVVIFAERVTLVLGF